MKRLRIWWKSRKFCKRTISVEFDNFFKIIENVYGVFGYKREEIEPTNFKERLKAILRRISAFTGNITLFVSIVLYLIWILVNYDDFFGVLRALPNISNIIFIVIRCFILRHNNSKIRVMCKDLKDIYEVLMMKHDRQAQNYLYRSNIFQRTCIGILVSTQLLQVCEFISNYIYHGTDIFTLEIWLPFDHESDLKYFASCLWISWSGFFCSSALFIGDWVIYTIITLTSLEFDYIGRKMKELLNNPKVKLGDLSAILNHQNKLIEVCNQLESIVSESLLNNFLQSIVLICLISFQLAILKDPLQLIVYGLVLIIVSFQIFMLCFHGQMLINSSSNIANEIYDSDWHSIEDMKVKRAIPLMLQISQREKCVTAFGFKRISIETLTLVRDLI